MSAYPVGAWRVRVGHTRAAGTALTLVALAALALASCAPNRANVRDGVATLDRNDEALRLTGEWVFQPGEGAPEDASPGLLDVPGVWDKAWPGLRSGTYRLRLDGLEPGALYALQLKGVSSNATVLADGEIIGAWNGVGSGTARYVPMTLYLSARSDSILLELSLRNDAHAWGGLWLPVAFGTAEALERRASLDRVRDAALLGAIAIMALYHLALFLLRPEARSAAWFAAVCLATVVKVGLSDEQLLGLLFPALDGAAGIRLAYLATIAIPPLFMAYLRETLPGGPRFPAQAILLAVGAAEAVLAVAAPLAVLQLWFRVYFVAIAIAGAYALALILSRVRLRSPGALPMLAGVIVLLAAAANDMLHDQKVINSFYSLGLGLFAFLFDQAVVMGGQFAKSFREARELAANLELRVAERTSELERLSRIDPLTGLVNRRCFWESLEREWDRWIRYGQDFCLALLDLDRFKALNDSLGHAAGDEALRNLGALLVTGIRRTDVAARYGGEEFCLILPGTDPEEAHRLLEKLRSAVEETPLVAGPPPVAKTLSYGIARASAHESPAELVDAADRLMYRAKEAGRNRGFRE